MSDAAERPSTSASSEAAAGSTFGPPDADAWATACEEDLASEKARRRAQYGPPSTSAAEELRRLADAVTEKVAELGKPFGGTVASAAAQGVAQQLIAQAKASIGPVVERNPQVFDHLASAGNELLAAYRSAVQDAERRWTSPDPARDVDPRDEAATPRTGEARGAERIDLDAPGGTGPAQDDPGKPESGGSGGDDKGGDGSDGDGSGGDDKGEGTGSGGGA